MHVNFLLEQREFANLLGLVSKTKSSLYKDQDLTSVRILVSSTVMKAVVIY